MITKYQLFEKLNSRGSKSLTESEFNQILKTSCKNWTKSKTSLYRGQIDLGPYVYTDPIGTHRKSIEDINTHIELMSNLESWRDYPKYSSSIIGSTSKGVGGYGKVYEIIPFDNVNIGVCPGKDIWESFTWGGDFGQFGEDIYKVHHFLEYVGINADVWDQVDGGTIESKLKSMDCIDVMNNDGGQVNLFLKEASVYLKKSVSDINGDDCYRFINEKIFNPGVNGFMKLKYNMGFEAPSNKQMWTEGPVLLIYSELA